MYTSPKMSMLVGVQEATYQCPGSGCVAQCEVLATISVELPVEG